MKIAITSRGENLDSEVDNRFGRCGYFAIYDSDTKDTEFIKNDAIMASRGAGIRTAEMLNNKGVKLVLTGNVGPNAISVLNAAKIDVALGISGTIENAIERFNKGDYEKSGNANVPPHSGLRSF